jgi:hypothetical protein
MDGLWEKANQVSEVAYKIEGISHVAKLLGESMSDDVNSGVAWTIAEMLDVYTEILEKLSEDIMAINKASVEAEAKPKGKKK